MSVIKRWGLYVVAWAACALELAAIFGGAHISRWQSAVWIIVLSVWVAIARIKDATIRTQQETIRIVRQHRDSLMQQQKAGLS